jgi:hypothetical protein
MRLNFRKLIVFIVLFAVLSPVEGNAIVCNECAHQHSATPEDTAADHANGNDTANLTPGGHLKTSDSTSGHTCFDGAAFAKDVFVKRNQRSPGLNFPLTASRSSSSLVTSSTLPATGKLANSRPAISQTILVHRTVVLLN